MAAKRASLVLAFLVALVLASSPLPATAQHRGGGGGGGRGHSGGGSHGGGGHYGGGGGYHGGGHAVPRGSAYHSSSHYGGHGGYSHGGHYGYSSHGYYGGHGHAYYGHGHGYYGRYYGGYYGYGYYPYGSAWFYGGWPYGYGASVSIGIGGHYSYPAYATYSDAAPVATIASAPAPESEVTYDAPVTETRDDSGRLRIVVTPADASLYVDDEYWGNARQLRSLALRAGQHTIEVVRPGFAPVRQQVKVVSGEMRELRVELARP